MRHYSMDDSHRLYSGYDEYTGSFGPLQVSASSGRIPPSRRGFVHSQSLGVFSKRRKTRRSVPIDYHNRAHNMVNTMAKKKFDDAENLQDKMNIPASPTDGFQRHVWLPTRNFAFRQRAGKLDVRAIARLNLEKIAATTDIETIQSHLENLAFADVTLDDVQHYSDAYFLKLFQIAQLTLEYLMHVQDSLVDHSERVEKQCETLMTECQQFESDNGQQEIEIASLKREIRQKQRTMATLELMLLNASAGNMSEKKSGAREANAVVNDLMADQADSRTVEEGSIANPVSCVLCKKRFISAEYLLHHQQRRHQDTKKKKQKREKSFSDSSSNSDFQERKKKIQNTTVSLPKEVVDALEEKNQLSKQFLILQDQVRAEQEARDQQRHQIESQQQQINSRIEQYMGRVQASLVEIEKKQAVTTQDLRLYTQEAIDRFQMEALNAERKRSRKQKTSRAGRLMNDDGEVTVTLQEGDGEWSDKVEKLMDTFLRTQALKQQEVDCLRQDSSKLWAKYNKLKKRQHRSDPRLAELSALDAERFGLDRGEVVEPVKTQNPIIVTAVAQLEDKNIQTDETYDKEYLALGCKPDALSKDTQMEQIPDKVLADVVSSVKVDAVERVAQPPTAVIPFGNEVSEPIDPLAKIHHAAYVIGKVALRFLARRAVAKSSDWRITIEVASIQASLTSDELTHVRQHFGSHLHVQVEASMTANTLRVLIAELLLEKQIFEATSGNDVKTTMMHHRVKLHHKHTGVELFGDTLIHELKNAIEVDIIPYCKIAALDLTEVIEIDTIGSNRIEDGDRVCPTMSASDLPAPKSDDMQHTLRDKNINFARLVRLQALIRGFLAKKNVEIMKIDRLMNSRLVLMESQRKDLLLEPSWMIQDPVLAGEYEKAYQRMKTKYHAISNSEGASDGDGSRTLSQVIYEKLRAGLRSRQNVLPCDVQCRIRLLTERLTSMAIDEYRRQEINSTCGVKTRTAGAAKVHRAVQIEVVRKRLKRLFADDNFCDIKCTNAEKGDASDHPAILNLSLSLLRSKDFETDKSVGTFDSIAIDQLADAYEEEESPVVSQKTKERKS